MVEVRIPKLGLTMESATIVEWQRGPGDSVGKGDIILVIETDKIASEIPSPATGLLYPIAAPEEVCSVEQIVGFIAADLTEYSELQRTYPL